VTITAIIPLLFALVFPACLLWAAFSDLTSYTITNRTNLIMAAGFIPFGLLVHLSPAAFGWHLGVGLLVLIIGMVLFSFRLFGGGDAKLIAAAALWLGKDASLSFLFYTALCGGALALILITLRKFIGVYAPRFPRWLAALMEAKAGVPYGVAICAGAFLAVPFSDVYALLKSLIFS